MISLQVGSDVPQAVTAATELLQGPFNPCMGTSNKSKVGKGMWNTGIFHSLFISLTCACSLAEQGTCSSSSSSREPARACSEQRPEECEQWKKCQAEFQPGCTTPAATAISDFSPNLCTPPRQEHFSRADTSPEHCLIRSSHLPFHLRTFSN